MITGDAIMLLVAATLAILSWRWGTPLPLLVFAGLLIGTVDAFYLPSTGSMPRRLVDDSQLARAVALRQGGSQLVSLVGGPIGGALVAVAGMAAASLADSFTFAVVLVALIAIRPRFTPPPIDQRRNLLRDAVDGIRVAVTTPGLDAALVLVAGAAGFVIPGTSLLVPLLAREHHWTAATAGLIVGAQGVGAIAATLCVARRGSASRPGIAAAIGLFVIAAGQLTVGLTAVIPLALTAAAFMGIGSGSFVSNLSPVLLGTAPASHLARIQALLTLVQSGALLATNNALGAIAYGVSATVAMLCCASVLTSCAVVAVLTPAIRRMR